MRPHPLPPLRDRLTLVVVATCLPLHLHAAQPDEIAPVTRGPVTDASASASPTPGGAPREGPGAMDLARAEHLLRFLSYVGFPPGAQPAPGQPFVIGVHGADEVFIALSVVLDRRLVQQRPVLRRQVAEGDPLIGVHVLYLGRGVDPGQSGLSRTARTLPLLLVCEHPDGLAAGAVFNFVGTEEPLRFEASVASAERVGLTVSSRVLTLAERVLGGR